MEPQATSVSQTSLVPPTPPTPQVKNSLVLIMSVLLIVTVAIAGLFYFQIQKLSKELSKYQAQTSPTPTATTDPTASWETYTNSVYKLSFKYPSTETAKITDYTGYLSTISLINTETQVEDLVFYIGTTDESLGYNKNDTNYTISRTSVDGLNAVHVSLPIGQNPPQELVFFTNNGKYYHFQFVWDGKDRKVLSLFDQILSTFKFIQENQGGGNQTKINCKNPRPEACTLECIANPPYICGSDGKSYCTICQACSNKDVAWYTMQATPCGQQ